MAAIPEFDQDAKALLGSQASVKERVSLIRLFKAREFPDHLLHNLIVRLNRNPAVLLRALQHFLQQLHAEQPIFERRIVQGS